MRWFARRRSRRTRCRPRTKEQHLFIQFRGEKFIRSSINQKERCQEASKLSSTCESTFKTSLEPSDYAFQA